ncbi:hypothetical protein F511_47758 [Dorcoceras hygrometricum]|uniref:Uncharacterized protein n=1 Tax=Dorcoceras hygrometricum TaxID=472368 RepID=A0A2Z6ZQB3_9LAMI|nr:hypothetical protein F511_47758 [Dorcoceras hygrometricum]
MTSSVTSSSRKNQLGSLHSRRKMKRRRSENSADGLVGDDVIGDVIQSQDTVQSADAIWR